jgi:glycosyltransferase involved in cell wall biosynthesis
MSHALFGKQNPPITRILVLTPFGKGGRGGIDRIMDAIRAKLDAFPTPDLKVSFSTTRGESHIALSFVLIGGTTLRLFGRFFGYGPDALHLNLAQYGSFYRKAFVAQVAQILGIPYIIHLHGSGFRQFWDSAPPYIAKRVRHFFLHADKVLVLGNVWHDFVVARVPEIASKIEILPNATPSVTVLPRNAANDKVSILFLGLLSERKGVPTLIKALAALPTDLPWRATLAGNGDEEGSRRRIKELDLEDRVDLPGWVRADKVDGYLAAADILVLPSHDENLPMSVIEGMAHGLAIVTTPVGAIADIIKPEVTGLLVPPGDSSALAEAMKRLICDAKLRSDLGSSARQFHDKYLDMDVYYKKLLQIWRDVGKKSNASVCA